MRLATRIGVIAVLIMSCVLSPGIGARAAELSGTPEELKDYLRSEVRTVTIRKKAEEMAYTDVAKITLSISTEARNLADAIQGTDSLRQSIFRELVESGIGEDSIHSSRYSASPQYGWFGDRPNSFEVVNSLVVTIDQQSEFQRVAAIADRNTSVSFAGVEFEHSEKEAYEDKVRDMAVEKVLAEQRFFEQRLGLKLSPVSFEYSDVNALPDTYGVLEEVIVTANRASSSGYRPRAPNPTFDEINYEVSVAVTFEVTGQNRQ